jgi:hypothetical protein
MKAACLTCLLYDHVITLGQEVCGWQIVAVERLKRVCSVVPYGREHASLSILESIDTCIEPACLYLKLFSFSTDMLWRLC